jgi:hypothetical protein
MSEHDGILVQPDVRHRPDHDAHTLTVTRILRSSDHCVVTPVVVEQGLECALIGNLRVEAEFPTIFRFQRRMVL